MTLPQTKAKKNDLADKLRKCYQFERNRDPRSVHRPDNYRVPACWGVDDTESGKNSVWHKLAAFCKRRDIDPLNYIHWCLSSDQVFLGPPPEPNQLLTIRRMGEYEAARLKRREYIRVRFSGEKRKAETYFGVNNGLGSDPERAWLMTLSNSSLNLSPLFLFAITKKIGGTRFLKIAERNHASALLQYQYDAADYDHICGDLIPPGFAEHAAALYDELLDREP